jgi:uncharacterized repeat protein (TIGR01451 family)
MSKGVDMRKATLILTLVVATLASRRVLADGYGCDSMAAMLTCTPVGACCDAHDAGFNKHRCTAGSWSCLNPFAVTPESCINGGGTYTTNGGFCTTNGTVQPTCSGDNPADATSDCAAVDTQVVGCILGGFAAIGAGAPGAAPGPSSCCGHTDYTSCGCARNSSDMGSYADSCSCPGGQSACPPPDNSCSSPGAVSAGGRCEPRDPPPPPPPPPPGPGPGPGGHLPCLFCLPPPGSPLFPPPGWPLLGPIDPNEMVGPPGVAPNNQVPVDVTMPYQVLFENDGNSTAQEIVVTDALPSTLDWTTLHFTAINYGGRKIVIPSGARSFTQLDLPPIDGCVLAGSGPLGVNVALGFNSSTGVITLHLTVVDTTTGDFPADASAGILPPSTACLGGSLEYSVLPLDSDEPGTVITNQASIVFDSNPAIVTNQVSNTIAP